jgi:hypothetical protein
MTTIGLWANCYTLTVAQLLQLLYENIRLVADVVM